MNIYLCSKIYTFCSFKCKKSSSPLEFDHVWNIRRGLSLLWATRTISKFFRKLDQGETVTHLHAKSFFRSVYLVVFYFPGVPISFLSSASLPNRLLRVVHPYPYSISTKTTSVYERRDAIDQGTNVVTLSHFHGKDLRESWTVHSPVKTPLNNW